MAANIWAPTPYNLSFWTYCLAALGNFIFLIVLTANSAQTNYATINRWDQIYHGHNLGAHICSIITIINMWRPKGFARTPALSILHFVGTEAVKLYFAGKWIKYWPKSTSGDWLVYTVASLNTTAPGEDGYETKHAVFEYYTKEYDITWAPDRSGDPRLPPWWDPKQPGQARFTEWIRGRTYTMVPPVISLAAVTTALGLLVCGLAYWEFLKIKSKPKATAAQSLQSDPILAQS
jgi:hypothetical protein